MSKRQVRNAIILAAGAGSRFWPYNVVRQKAAFPVANVPVIRRLVDELVALGIEQIVVVVGPLAGSVRSALRHHSAAITFVQQGQEPGNAVAALAGMRVISPQDEAVLIVHGDVVTAPENLKAVLCGYQEGMAAGVVLVQPFGKELPQDWVSAFVRKGRLDGVEGHSRGGEYRLCGVYVLPPQVGVYLRDNPGIMERVPVGGMPAGEAEIAQSLQSMLDDGFEIAAVTAAAYHVDLDKPWHILEANQAILVAESAALFEDKIGEGSRVHDGADIGGHVVLGNGCLIGNRVTLKGPLWLADGARVENGAIIEGPAVIGRESVVRDYCLLGEYTTVGARGVYGHGAEFSGVALDKVYCYHYCEIWGVVGNAVDFGAATVCGNLRFDDGITRWRIKGRWEQPAFGANAAYFGDYSRTGVNAIIMPGKRIGVYSCIGAGVIVYDDVPDRQLLLLQQEVTTRTWGPEQYGW
jgi:UDP-N-acetylglucosamine diphosphorylase / glucose-1-phosphate thymidylyltransferase / UDP-N-acetylgalactosamine diphosphorylase / glucosamine-1-phosphate N-acetyltransferase / galactosamine-1-phosphate N-acetyltransferase